MTRPVDAGREAVYAAEVAAFEGTTHESLVSFDLLLALASEITSAPWWPCGPIAVVPARADAGSSSARQRSGGAPVVRLAAPQLTAATLIHELAHVLAGVAGGHGPTFRRAHVDLAGHALGDTPAGWLVDAYAGMGLELGARAWPAPPRRDAAGPIAL